MVGSTYQGGGRPRLRLAMGGMAPEGSQPREFSLRETATTRIGSRAGADLQLDGLAEDHAEIRYERGDEYVLVDLGAPGGSRVNGQPVEQAELHTGDRIEVGDWTLSYYREEYADHGRPRGGRSGGESVHEPPRDDLPDPRLYVS
jgi:pSer/pThr/pTyr-binding forkhead associated (FHA) protein